MLTKSVYDRYDPKEFEVVEISEKCVHLSQHNTRLVLFFYFNEEKELIAIEFEEVIASWGTNVHVYEGNREDERWVAHENVWKKFKTELNLDFPQ